MQSSHSQVVILQNIHDTSPRKSSKVTTDHSDQKAQVNGALLPDQSSSPEQMEVVEEGQGVFITEATQLEHPVHSFDSVEDMDVSEEVEGNDEQHLTDTDSSEQLSSPEIFKDSGHFVGNEKRPQSSRETDSEQISNLSRVTAGCSLTVCAQGGVVNPVQEAVVQRRESSQVHNNTTGLTFKNTTQASIVSQALTAVEILSTRDSMLHE